MRSFLPVLFVAGLACRSEPVHEIRAVPLRLDSLVSSQITRLAKEKAVLVKKGSVDGVESSAEREVPDSAGWRSNLELFAMHYPSAWSSVVRESSGDSASNLDLERFTFGKGPIAEMLVYSVNPGRRIRRIEIHYRDSNRLLYDDRQMRLDFGEREGSPLLEAYQVTGLNKVVARDTVHYWLEGRIEWPQ
jgi:hypothetical protein